ncbi:MAG: NAD(P)/FAD-dependent oxidoreductase, partial [Acidobacteriota bacterium]
MKGSPMDHNRFDVIVVGGGPAGITAAAALGRRGFSVLVCEAAVYPGAENWSGAVYFTENLESDEAFGKRAIAEGPIERPLTERGFYLYNGHSLLGAALRDPQVFRSSYTVLRPVFDRYLAELAREHGAVVMNETTVQSLIRNDGRVIGVHTERGPAYADVVFLADGDASHLVTQE